jgi:hypothetical protein
LIVDEADRVVEEGHFPELHRLFNRIKEHEHIASQGLQVREVEKKKKIGTFAEDYFPAQKDENEDMSQESDGNAYRTYYEDNAEDNNILPLDAAPYDDFEPMPSEEDLHAARQTLAFSNNEDNVSSKELTDQKSSHYHSKIDRKHTHEENHELASSQAVSYYIPNQRQTFLYSATAIVALLQNDRIDKKTKGKKTTRKLLKNIPEHLKNLPYHLQE